MDLPTTFEDAFAEHDHERVGQLVGGGVSEAKDPNANKAITLQRLLATQKFISDTANSVLTAEEASAVEDKVVFIQLGDRQAIDARFYGNQAGNRPIAWDSATEAQICNLVENGDRIADASELRWRARTLNQVVFIVPIHCKLPGGTP